MCWRIPQNPNGLSAVEFQGQWFNRRSFNLMARYSHILVIYEFRYFLVLSRNNGCCIESYSSLPSDVLTLVEQKVAQEKAKLTEEEEKSKNLTTVESEEADSETP